MSKGFGLLKSFGKDKISYENLRKMNVAAAVLLALQGILILALTTTQKGLYPINVNFLNQDSLASSAGNDTLYAPAVHHLFNLKIAYVIAAFFFVGAISRWLLASSHRKQYEASLKRGVNKYRWMEHGAVLALVMVSIALIFGVSDLLTLVFIIWLAGLMAWLSYKLETYSQTTKKTDWQMFTVIGKAGVMIWLAILVYLLGALVWGHGLPTYAYFVYASLLIIGGGFAYNGYRSFKKDGRWANNLWSERVYIILTLLATSVLAWQIFAGALV